MLQICIVKENTNTLLSTEEKHLLVKSSVISAFIYFWREAITVVQSRTGVTWEDYGRETVAMVRSNQILSMIWKEADSISWQTVYGVWEEEKGQGGEQGDEVFPQEFTDVTPFNNNSS